METIDQVLLTVGAALRLATPLLLAALAGLYSERSGILDIGLEGKMLVGAFSAAAMAAATGSALFGLAAGMLMAGAYSMLHGFACITHHGNQIVSGVALNILASGLTGLLAAAWYANGGSTPTLPAEARFLPIELPLADVIGGLPVFGPFYARVIGGHNILVYFALLAAPATWYLLYRTPFGLRLRAVGENPRAVETAGLSVSYLRYRAVMISGVLCGASGAYLSTGLGSGFLPEMTVGKGYIALAALIFGKWRPMPTLFACLLFGVLEAAASRVQGTPLFGSVPAELLQVLPYLATVVVLALFVGRAVPPQALGRPYSKVD